MLGGFVVLAVIVGGTIVLPLAYWIAQGCPHVDDGEVSS